MSGKGEPARPAGVSNGNGFTSATRWLLVAWIPDNSKVTCRGNPGGEGPAAPAGSLERRPAADRRSCMIRFEAFPVSSAIRPTRALPFARAGSSAALPASAGPLKSSRAEPRL